MGASHNDSPTVRQAADEGLLVSARLVAGEEGLDRRIESLHVVESGDDLSRIQPGGLVVAQSCDSRLLNACLEYGAAALIVREAPSSSLSDLARRLSISLFLVGETSPWEDLLGPLTRRVMAAEHTRLRRSMAIHARFTELVLDGQGIDTICATLADLLGTAVTVEDAGFHLLAHAGGSDVDRHRRETITRQGTPPNVLFDPAIQRMLREVDARRHPSKVQPFPHLGMDRERILAPIAAAGQVLGYISVVGQPPEAEDLAFMAVEHAATVCALAMLKEREVMVAESSVRGEFLEDLLAGTYGDAAAAQRRARHLRYPLAGQHVLTIIDIDNFQGFHSSRQLTEDAIQALKRDFLRRVTAVIRDVHPKALVHGRSDMAIALLPVTETQLERKLRQLGDSVRAAIADWQPGFTVSVGFSSPTHAPEGVESAHREVRAVLETYTRFGRGDHVVSTDDLGVSGLLAALPDERLAAFVSRRLGALQAHDAQRRGVLVETLRAFLEEGEQLRAARRLDIHVNTLRYRLERIAEIAEADLADPEVRLNLAVAIRIHHLLPAASRATRAH